MNVWGTISLSSLIQSNRTVGLPAPGDVNLNPLAYLATFAPGGGTTADLLDTRSVIELALAGLPVYLDLTAFPDFEDNQTDVYARINSLTWLNRSQTDAQNVLLGGNTLTPPPAPAPTTATTGGTVAAGTYYVTVTYTNAAGETVAGAQGSVVTTGATSTITIPSPTAALVATLAGSGGSALATGWKAYTATVSGGPYHLQGGTNTIGTGLTLTTTPSAVSAAPPSTNGATIQQWVGWMQPAGAFLALGPGSAVNPLGGFGCHCAPNLTGYPVTGTSKILKVDPQGFTLSFDLEIAGRSV